MTRVEDQVGHDEDALAARPRLLGVIPKPQVCLWDQFDLRCSELPQSRLVCGMKIDHPRNGTKDMADALANAVWELCEEMGLRPEAYRAPVSSFYKGIESLPQIESIDEVEFHELDI